MKCSSSVSKFLRICLIGLASLGASSAAAESPAHHRTAVMWINHLDFLPMDGTVSVTSAPGPTAVVHGLSRLVIRSALLGDTGEGGVNKEVLKGLQVPPGFLITGVRVCYELSDPRTFITQIRLAQVQDPPSSALVLLDDPTNLTNPGPVCVDSAPTSVDPGLGQVRLSLRVNFGGVVDEIVLRAVALHLRHTH